MRAHIDASSLVETTRALVAADTRNPPGNERLAADVARQILEPLGATFDEVEPAPGRTSLLATISSGDRTGGAPRPTLLINGHLDVVPIDPDGWTRDPFAGEVEADGRMYGRGAADMKGGIASAIEAVRALQRSEVDLPCDVVFHLVADEERGGRMGTGVLAQRGLIHADACLVPEPTSLGVCIAERGLLQAEISVRGRAAHASEPSRGVSAVEKAARLVVGLHGADFGGARHPLLGAPTLNAAMISGGRAPNIVADHCVLTIDRRTLPGMTEASTLDELRRSIDALHVTDLDYDIDVLVFGEASELQSEHPWVDFLQAHIAAELGAPATVLGMTFATDARFVRNDAGVPAIVFGPGSIEQAHVNDEWVEVDALVDAAAVMARLIASFDGAAASAVRGNRAAPINAP
jgi:acetylornithine deacetylase/succinyl-diaminopimelate desuccinylase family protein